MTAQDDAILTLPPPALAPEALAGHLARHWGLSGRLTPLTSERDLNHRLDCAEGRFVLRLTNPAEPAEMTDFQSRAHLHVATRDPGLPVQRLVPMADGSHVLALPEGRLRLFTWLPGTPLAHLPSGLGQTRAAHKLCTGIPETRRVHLTAQGAGHYGIFSGRRWRDQVYPQVRDFIAKYAAPTSAGKPGKSAKSAAAPRRRKSG